MTLSANNSFQLECEIVEIISKDDKRIIKAMCNLGRKIIEIPDDGQVQLNDIFSVSGTIYIDHIKTDPNKIQNKNIN